MASYMLGPGKRGLTYGTFVVTSHGVGYWMSGKMTACFLEVIQDSKGLLPPAKSIDVILPRPLDNKAILIGFVPYTFIFLPHSLFQSGTVHILFAVRLILSAPPADDAIPVLLFTTSWAGIEIFDSNRITIDL